MGAIYQKQLDKIRDRIEINKQSRPLKRPVIRYYKVHRRTHIKYKIPLEIKRKMKDLKWVKQVLSPSFINPIEYHPFADYFWNHFWEWIGRTFCQGK